MAFHCAAFYSEGAPHDKALELHTQFKILKASIEPHCSQFHGYSARRVRRIALADGTRGADYVREYSKSAGYLNFPNAGYSTVGFGAFKPFVILHVLERMALGDLLFFSDVNVFKHWQLQAFPHLAAETTRWLLDAYGREDVAMPRENPSMTHLVTCSARALDAAERSCGGKDLASLPSPHSNRVAVRNSPRSAAFLRLWLNATQDEYTFLPAPTRKEGRCRLGKCWHQVEQCAFGLIDACRHGKSEVWFEYFYTRQHARLIDEASFWANKRPR